MTPSVIWNWNSRWVCRLWYSTLSFFSVDFEFFIERKLILNLSHFDPPMTINCYSSSFFFRLSTNLCLFLCQDQDLVHLRNCMLLNFIHCYLGILDSLNLENKGFGSCISWSSCPINLFGPPAVSHSCFSNRLC